MINFLIKNKDILNSYKYLELIGKILIVNNKMIYNNCDMRIHRTVFKNISVFLVYNLHIILSY